MHTNILNGKSYIGKTVKSINHRWKQHIILSNTSSSAFHRAIKKHGTDCWDSVTLINNSSDLNDDEIKMIELHQTHTTNGGYNMTTGGDGGAAYGEDNPFYGKSHSPESKQKISKAKRGISVNAGKDNHSFSGYYVTPWGIFESPQKAANNAPVKMSIRSILSLCKRNDRPINKVQLVKSAYLQSIDHRYATPRELGFDFKPIR